MLDNKLQTLTGDQWVLICAALSNPIRWRIMAALHGAGRVYVSQLARDLQISRPLLHLHLQKLEEALLVKSQLELSPEGKALNFFSLTEFSLTLTPQILVEAAKSLSLKA